MNELNPTDIWASTRSIWNQEIKKKEKEKLYIHAEAVSVPTLPSFLNQYIH